LKGDQEHQGGGARQDDQGTSRVADDIGQERYDPEDLDLVAILVLRGEASRHRVDPGLAAATVTPGRSRATAESPGASRRSLRKRGRRDR
jgi:hypothetical protein